MALSWNILRVRDRKQQYEELLIDIDVNSFVYTWNRDLQRSVSFTVQRTNFNAFSFDLLQEEGFIKYRNQLYIIKQCVPRVIGTQYEKQITANHVGFEIQDHVINEVTGQNVTMNLKQYLDFYIKGNKLGYTYEIKGKFDTTSTFETIGGKSALTAITEGKDLYNYIAFCDNRHWIFYDEDTFYIDAGREIRYLYNTDEVTVTTDTTSLKTAVRAYGKMKEENELNYSTASVESLNLTGTYSKNTTWYTTEKNATATATIKINKKGDKLYMNQRLGVYGGKANLYINGKLESVISFYNNKVTTKKWLIADDLAAGDYTIKLTFIGDDTAHKPPSGKLSRMYLGTSGNNIFITESNAKYYAQLDYISPNAKEWGEKWSEPITNDTIKDEKTLKEWAARSIQDYPLLSVAVNYKGTKDDIQASYMDEDEPTAERQKWHFYHEVLGFDTDLKIVELRNYHPFSKKPQEMTFSNAKKDILTMQKQLINSVKNIDSRTRAINSQLIGINEKVAGTGFYVEKA